MATVLINAAYARFLEVRRLLLIGRLDEAEQMLGELDPAIFSPASGLLTSWSLQESRCDVSGRRRHALRLLAPRRLRAAQVSSR
jgi:hypothetical protein